MKAGSLRCELGEKQAAGPEQWVGRIPIRRRADVHVKKCRLVAELQPEEVEEARGAPLFAVLLAGMSNVEGVQDIVVALDASQVAFETDVVTFQAEAYELRQLATPQNDVEMERRSETGLEVIVAPRRRESSTRALLRRNQP